MYCLAFYTAWCNLTVPMIVHANTVQQGEVISLHRYPKHTTPPEIWSSLRNRPAAVVRCVFNLFRAQIPDYSTRRLPGLDVLPSDARAMMRAKAKKSKSTASFGVDAGSRPRTSGGIMKRGGFAASHEGPSARIGTASAIVAATGITAMRL